MQKFAVAKEYSLFFVMAHWSTPDDTFTKCELLSKPSNWPIWSTETYMYQQIKKKVAMLNAFVFSILCA